MSKPLSKNSLLDKKLSNFSFWKGRVCIDYFNHSGCMNICLCFIIKVWHSTGVPSLVGPQPMALAIGRFASPCTQQEFHGPCFTTPSTHIRCGHTRVIFPFSSSNLIEKSSTLHWKRPFRALPSNCGNLIFFSL